VVDLAGYPGLIYAAYDAGPNGYSTIQCYNGTGWCEVYRAPVKGARIRNLYIQAIPGEAVDRLWFSCGSDAIWVPLSVDPHNHPSELTYSIYNYTYQNYLYHWQGEYITPWYYVQLKEVQKYYKSIKAINDSVGMAAYVYYMLDTATGYTYLGSLDAYADEETIGLAGRRIRLKFLIGYGRITNTILECITRVPHKYEDAIVFRVADRDIDLNGKPDDYADYMDKLNVLDGWALSATPVTISSMAEVLNGKQCFIEAPSMRPGVVNLDDGREAYLCQLTLLEI
jgi:hypothetical protein